MAQVDMSASAVTARLRLVSDLRDLCQAQLEQEPGSKPGRSNKRKSTRNKKSK
jgi:hypothetical protein